MVSLPQRRLEGICRHLAPGSRTLSSASPLSPAAASIGYATPTLRTDRPPAPTLRGGRYRSCVPATLDLAERARLAIHAMTSNPDAETDYEVHWAVSLLPAPRMRADFSSASITPKFMEATLCG